MVELRLEILNLRTAGGKAKIIGTITGISGAMILTFVKGLEVKMLSFHINLFNHPNNNVAHPHATSGVMTIFGALASIASNVSYALWLIIQVSFILHLWPQLWFGGLFKWTWLVLMTNVEFNVAQAKMSERYPHPYSSTALMSLMGALLSVSYAFCVERDLSQWRLGWNIRLLTVAYAVCMFIILFLFLFGLTCWLDIYIVTQFHSWEHVGTHRSLTIMICRWT